MTPDNINPQTRSVFFLLATLPEFSESDLCLVGGTAIALHCGHRNSLDLDFNLLKSGRSQTLPRYKINKIVAGLKQRGHAVQMITDPSKVSEFKINTGLDMLDFAQDYVINGVKVTFFFRPCADNLITFYQLNAKAHPDIGFRILDVDGLAVSKSLLLENRVRSRDLFDLYWLIDNGHFSLSRLFNAISQYANNNDEEYYKAILSGTIPIDRDDEGLEPVNPGINLEGIYEFFKVHIDRYEQDVARTVYQS